MTDERPKAQMVELVGGVPDSAQVMKIVRPVVESAPLFQIYTKDEGLILAYPFDSEVGRVLRQLVGDEGTTYHRAVETDQGLVFEGDPVEGLSW